MSACNWKLYNDFIKFIYIIPSLLKKFFNFGDKTVSLLDAKFFFSRLIFLTIREIWDKKFFQGKKFEAKIFFIAQKFYTSREIDPLEENYPLRLKTNAEAVC